MKSTKKTLLFSVLAMVVCVAIFAGSTFAWFTDIVNSGNNKIIAGNLDIELEYSKDGETWKTIEGATKLFDDVAFWEPGVVSVVYLRLTNKGKVALKYNLAVTSTGGDFTNVAGESKNLKDALKFAQVAGDAITKYDTREAALSAVEACGLGLNDYAQTNSMASEAVSYLTLVVAMPTTIGNEFNYKTGTEAPKIELSVAVTATQFTAESDSFDKYYDAAAPWLGGLDDFALSANTDDTAKTVTIETAEQLASFAKSVNSGAKDYSSFTIKLANDIDLNNIRWTPISATANHSFVKFDGQNHTIKNLKVEQSKNAGLFGTLSGGDIENLIIDGANISGNDYAGAIIGTAYDSYIKNCEVKNATVTVVPYLKDNGTEYDGGAKAGAIVGYLTAQSNVSVENCKVDTATVSAYRDLGGLVGYAQGAAKVTDNKILNVKLNYIFVAPYDSKTPNQNMGDYYGRYDAAINASGNEGTAEKGEANVLTTAQDLVMFATAVNGGISYAGQTVKLGADIDLAGIAWTPIGGATMGSYPSVTFEGTFDGQNYTISNLTCVSLEPNYATAGFFGSTTGSVKNLILKNIDITSSHYAGGIVAYSSSSGSNVENCHVDGGKITSAPEWLGTKYDNGDKVGGIFGLSNEGASIIGCSVKNLTIKAYREIGGIAGRATGAFTNNKVENVTIIQDNTNGYKTSITTYGIFVGDGTTVDDTNTSENVKISKITPVVVPQGATAEQTQTAVNDAAAAASAGDIVVLPNTDNGVKLPAVASGVTLKGDGTTKIDATAALPNINGATLDGFVMKCGQSNYHGFTHSDAVIKNCTIEGLLFSYNAGGEQVFENCTFINDKEGGEYNMWAYGSVSYKNCIFKSYGKFVNVYNEGTDHFDVNFEDCKFINLKATPNKAAVNVKDTSSSNQLNITVTINNCSYEGAAPDVKDTPTLIVYNPVVQLDDIGAGPSNIIIKQDGITLWPKN